MRRRLRQWLKAEDGGVTIEFVLWIPVFFALVMLSADVSLLFQRQSTYWAVSRDTARIVARHGTELAQAQDWAAEQSTFAGYRPEVNVSIDPVHDTVTVRISGAAEALAPLGMLRFALGDRIHAEVTMVREPI